MAGERCNSPYKTVHRPDSVIVIDDEGNVTVLVPTFDGTGDWGPGTTTLGRKRGFAPNRMTPRSAQRIEERRPKRETGWDHCCADAFLLPNYFYDWNLRIPQGHQRPLAVTCTGLIT